MLIYLSKQTAAPFVIPRTLRRKMKACHSEGAKRPHPRVTSLAPLGQFTFWESPLMVVRLLSRRLPRQCAHWLAMTSCIILPPHRRKMKACHSEPPKAAWESVFRPNGSRDASHRRDCGLPRSLRSLAMTSCIILPTHRRSFRLRREKVSRGRTHFAKSFVPPSG